ncbi:hypothetical protein Psuf_041120 [Phytohabitans suffuscus]|uniref:NAD(P)H-hydrate epimerase n=1 Tax=Phytohabitans suffuscus TaxID=624315 RepID=A0A6F8YL98_9ACTN|nr:hypothetical protein Psuf_041120 [Phytohabitans suffuscus]
MRRAWRVGDVRAAEEALMRTVPDGVLMQRAAVGLARRCALLLAERGGVYGSRVLLLAGAGNNGGDALYAGALLAGRGAAVSALLLAPQRVHQGGLAALRRAGGRVVDAVPRDLDLAVDGIVGLGGSGGLRPSAEAAVRLLNARGTTIVAVDIPSGVDVDTGGLSGPVVRADVTVTFGCLKPALVVGPAAPYAGEVELVDIGLEPWLRADAALAVPEWPDIERWWPAWRPPPRSTPGASWASRPARRPIRARLSSPWAARWPARRAWSGTRGAPRPTCCATTRR